VEASGADAVAGTDPFAGAGGGGGPGGPGDTSDAETGVAAGAAGRAGGPTCLGASTCASSSRSRAARATDPDARSRAIAVECRPDRAERVGRNATALGVPGIEVACGAAPAALTGLARPDAIFVGGGLTSDGVLKACWEALPPRGRLQSQEPIRTDELNPEQADDQNLVLTISDQVRDTIQRGLYENLKMRRGTFR